MIKRRWKLLLKILVSAAVIWLILSLWFHVSGKQYNEWLKVEGSSKNALIVFNPDPFYDLDEKVCKSFARALNENQISCHIVTTRRLENLQQPYDLYMFCTNSYNWGPDWGLTNRIKSWDNLHGQKAIAITVGAGSTMRAQRKLEWFLKDKGVEILASHMYWYFKPDEGDQDIPNNIRLAEKQAYALGNEVSKEINQQN